MHMHGKVCIQDDMAKFMASQQGVMRARRLTNQARRSWHRLGPVDMPFEAKRSRHTAVAIPEVAVGGFVAVSPSQQRPQPQQPDVAYHQALIGWRGR